MPKVPRGELSDYGLDPESEEYSPTEDELKSDSELIESAKDEFYEISSRVGEKARDPYTWEDDDYYTRDPDDLWDSLAYLQIDVIDHIKDPEERKKLEVEISELDKEIYLQYIPYIDAQINIFGKANSPLEKYKPRFAKSPEEIIGLFSNARSIIDNQEHSEEESLEYLAEIDQLHAKFDRYQAAPTLPTFERLEKELFKEIDREYLDDISRYGTKKAKTFAEDSSWGENTIKFDKMIAAAHQLKEIASRMLSKDIRESCEARAQSLFWQAESLKFKFESPRELLELDAKIKDIAQKAERKEDIDNMDIEEITSELSRLEAQKIGLDHKKQVDDLKRLLENAKKVMRGEEVFEEDEQVEISKEDMFWSWQRMGLDRSADEKTIKKSFRSLIKKYHPDINKAEDAKEKMQKINEAYEFLARLKGFK